MRVHLPDVSRFRRRRRRSGGDLSYVRWLKLLRAGNLVQPLRAEKAFPPMLAAIAAARKHIHFETYILRADRTGDIFKAALIERARAGVRVRLLYDSLGSFGLPGAYIAELAEAGVTAIEYHPLVPWRARWNLNKRDHQKILIVDDEVAFTGGLNIGNDSVPVEDGGDGWFDVHARVEGPAVRDLVQIFRRTWARAGGEPVPDSAVEKSASKGNAAVQVISSTGVGGRWRMHRAYIHAIWRAEKSISIMNAYFIPDRGLRRAFARAVARGVSVRVIVPSDSDVRAVYFASRHLYSRLMRRGVRIFEWPDHMMHAKVGVIDGVWSTIGSYNLDRRSLLHNLEVSLVIIDRKLGGTMHEQFEKDVAHCREIAPVEWQKRSIWEKAIEWMFYQVRYWL
ncbi:MAG TPA: phospholipase D-like domain-containing protein [Planctomycetota bacterium]|jgi:cardiolipin synthase|nr:phospholipase D-like domain-containing protein [Planctomycetota bacterium]